MAKTIIYDGRHDSVDLTDPKDGSVIDTDIARGDEVTVPNHVAKELLAGDQWKAKPVVAKTKPKPASNKAPVQRAEKGNS